jgi:hypothetical protein
MFYTCRIISSICGLNRENLKNPQNDTKRKIIKFIEGGAVFGDCSLAVFGFSAGSYIVLSGKALELFAFGIAFKVAVVVAFVGFLILFLVSGIHGFYLVLKSGKVQHLKDEKEIEITEVPKSSKSFESDEDIKKWWEDSLKNHKNYTRSLNPFYMRMYIENEKTYNQHPHIKELTKELIKEMLNKKNEEMKNFSINEEMDNFFNKVVEMGIAHAEFLKKSNDADRYKKISFILELILNFTKRTSVFATMSQFSSVKGGKKTVERKHRSLLRKKLFNKKALKFMCELFFSYCESEVKEEKISENKRRTRAAKRYKNALLNIVKKMISCKKEKTPSEKSNKESFLRSNELMNSLKDCENRKLKLEKNKTSAKTAEEEKEELRSEIEKRYKEFKNDERFKEYYSKDYKINFSL